MILVNLPYTIRIKDRYGHYRYYYRRQGQRIPIKNDLGEAIAPNDDGFTTAYNRIHDMFNRPGVQIKAGSLKDLAFRYYKSPEFKNLKPRTQKGYRSVIDKLTQNFGDLPVHTMPRAFVINLRDSLNHVPAVANQSVRILKRLLSYAEFLQWIETNPCKFVKPLKTGGGARIWQTQDIEAFRKYAPQHLLLPFEIGLNSGMRLGDVLSLTWNNYDGSFINYQQSKTGEILSIPCTKSLKDMLDKTPRVSTQIVTNTKGMPYKSFQKVFKNACDGAGISGLSFHGLRKTAASTLAENGASESEIMAFTGHKSSAMIKLYTKQASQKKQAQNAVLKFESVKQRG